MTRINPSIAARPPPPPPPTLFSSFPAPPPAVPHSIPQPAASDDSKYPAKTHARAVAKHLPTKSGLVLVAGQVAANYEDSDMAPRFRQRRYFQYLTGVTDIAGCAAVYCLETDRLTLFIPPLDPASVLWSGMPLSPAECAEK